MSHESRSSGASRARSSLETVYSWPSRNDGQSLYPPVLSLSDLSSPFAVQPCSLDEVTKLEEGNSTEYYSQCLCDDGGRTVGLVWTLPLADMSPKTGSERTIGTQNSSVRLQRCGQIFAYGGCSYCAEVCTYLGLPSSSPSVMSHNTHHENGGGSPVFKTLHNTATFSPLPSQGPHNSVNGLTASR